MPKKKKRVGRPATLKATEILSAVRVPKRLKVSIHRRAKRERIGVSELIRSALENYLSG